MDHIYWSVCSSSRRGGYGAKDYGGIVVLASCEHHFLRVHKNLVQHPNNNISIKIRNCAFCDIFRLKYSHIVSTYFWSTSGSDYWINQCNSGRFSFSLSYRNNFSSMASNPNNIRWIRTGSQPEKSLITSIADNFPRIFN